MPTPQGAAARGPRRRGRHVQARRGLRRPPCWSTRVPASPLRRQTPSSAARGVRCSALGRVVRSCGVARTRAPLRLPLQRCGKSGRPPTACCGASASGFFAV